MDDTTWLALTVALTVVGALVTWLAWKRRGTAPALRAGGVTLLVPAAYLTGALPLVVDIAGGIGRWATGLVFSPVVWTGVATGGVGVLLFLLGGSMMARGRGVTAHTAKPTDGPADRPAAAPAGRQRREVPPASSGGTASSGDDGMDDIEAILRKRGIT